jgi:hypothetical protein
VLPSNMLRSHSPQGKQPNDKHNRARTRTVGQTTKPIVRAPVDALVRPEPTRTPPTTDRPRRARCVGRAGQTRHGSRRTVPERAAWWRRHPPRGARAAARGRQTASARVPDAPRQRPRPQAGPRSSAVASARRRRAWRGRRRGQRSRARRHEHAVRHGPDSRTLSVQESLSGRVRARAERSASPGAMPPRNLTNARISAASAPVHALVRRRHCHYRAESRVLCRRTTPTLRTRRRAPVPPNVKVPLTRHLLGLSPAMLLWCCSRLQLLFGRWLPFDYPPGYSKQAHLHFLQMYPSA